MVDRRGLAPRTAGCKPADFLANLAAQSNGPKKMARRVGAAPTRLSFGDPAARWCPPCVQPAGFAPASPEWRSGILALERWLREAANRQTRRASDAFHWRVHPKKRAPFSRRATDGPGRVESIARPSKGGKKEQTPLPRVWSRRTRRYFTADVSVFRAHLPRSPCLDRRASSDARPEKPVGAPRWARRLA
jgi:hypothetical protein